MSHARRRARLAAALLAVAALAAPRATRAQSGAATTAAATAAAPVPPSIAPASFVRLRTPDLADRHEFVGTVESVDTAGVAVRTARGTWTVPWSAVAAADVRVGTLGRGPATWRGGRIGLLLGIVGGVVWNTTYSLQRSSRVKNAVTGAALGAAVGAYFGGRTVREVWQPAALPPRLR